MNRTRKIVSVILALAMLFSCFVVGEITASAETPVWDGESITMPVGEGTEENPYLVSNGAELAWMIRNSGHHYKLTADIYLNDVKKINWQTGEAEQGYTPNSWYTSKQVGSTFSGYIDGDGHVVYGLYYNNDKAADFSESDSTGYGLIPSGGEVTIKNLGIDKSYLRAYSYYRMGTFVGSGQGTLLGLIDGCYTGADVTLTGYDCGAIVGGANIKKDATLTIKNTYSLASLTAERLKGLVGDSWTAQYTFENVYAVGYPIKGSHYPEIVANVYSTSKNSAWADYDKTTKLTKEQMQGSVAGGNRLVLGDAFIYTDTYPILKKFVNLVDWDGKTIIAPKGQGTEDSPYLVSNGAELAWMIRNSGNHYKLMADIYLNDVEKINWQTGEAEQGYTPNSWYTSKQVGSAFSGYIDGNGHVIYGLYYNIDKAADFSESDSTGYGLIPSGGEVTIKNLGIDKSYLRAYSYYRMGTFVGSGQGTLSGLIDGCYTGADVTLTGYDCGAIVAGGQIKKDATLTIKNTYSLASLTAERLKGLVGDSWTAQYTFENVYAVGYPIKGSHYPEIVANVYSTSKNSDWVDYDKTIKLTKEQMQGSVAGGNSMVLGNAFIYTDTYPVLKVFSHSPVWDGETISTPYGQGTEENPYLVSDGAELAWMIRNSGHYYKLTRDIHLNDAEKINWQTGEAEQGYTPNTWYNSGEIASAFSGTIDGNGHVIYGLYYNLNKPATVSGTVGYGLIPSGGDVTIKNLGIDKSYLKAYTNFSLGTFIGACGGMLSGLIDGCYSGEEVTLIGYDCGALVGGGQLKTGGMLTIKNAYTLASLKADNRQGLVGDSWTAQYTFENVYAVGYPIKGSHYPEIVANVYSTSINSAWADYDKTAKFTKEQMQGRVTDGNSMVLGDAFIATDTYPVLKVFCDKETTGWSGLAEAFTKGDGASADTAYEISTLGQFAHAVALGSGKYYKLTNDIYINDVNKIDWANGKLLDDTYVPTEWFSGADSGSAYYKGFKSDIQWKGALDGNGFTVYGLYYPNDFSSSASGLIPAATSATIKNLHLSKAYVVGGRFAGAISSYFAGTLDGVVVDDTVTAVFKKNVTADSFSCAGMVGFSNGVALENCAFYGQLITRSNTPHVYGFVGTSWGTNIHATNCYTVGYQPFTASAPAKTYNTKEEAEADYTAYFNSIYKVQNVYTDTKTQANNCQYRYDANGDGSADTFNYEAFKFNQLNTSQMNGKNALNNMTGLSSDIWYATEDVPRTKLWATTNGDADLDGMQAMVGDYAAIRKAIIGTDNTGCTDFDHDGNTNVLDLVKVYNLTPTHYKAGFTYTLEHIGDPGEYQIVYAANDAVAKKAAEALQKAYEEQGIAISVISDSDGNMTDKEILVGDTNRGLHTDGLPDGNYTITVIGDKIQISASESIPATINTAVKTYAQLSPVGFAAVTEGWYEFEGDEITLNTAMTNWLHKDTKPKNFTYVWGDEFYGNNLNKNKWVCTTGTSKMGGFSDLQILDTRDEGAVVVSDGSLKMIANKRADGTYTAPASVHTQGTMEFKYGYVEIRAKVPYKAGVWPSFWMRGDTKLGGRQNFKYFTEIDMFEVFGHTSELYCNAHRWYSSDSAVTPNHHWYSEDGKSSGFLSGFFDEPMGEDKKTMTSTTDWHTYGFGWDADRMYMYVDRQLFKVFDISSADKIFRDEFSNADSDMSGFDDPLYIVFNNHLFTQNSDWKPTSTNVISSYEQNLPATLEIDYVRVYRQNDNANTQIWTKQ